LLILVFASYLHGHFFSGPFVLRKNITKIETDLAFAGLNSDHVGL